MLTKHFIAEINILGQPLNDGHLIKPILHIFTNRISEDENASYLRAQWLISTEKN